MANARDVAKAAGVSVSTVSRALVAPDQVSDATRRRVVEAAERLGYRPNPVARGLRLGRTHAVGLIVPDLENPYFASVTKGVQARARAEGYAVFVADTDEDASVEAELVAGLAARVDGLILASPRSDDATLLAAVEGSVAVLANRELDGLPSIALDDADGAAQVLGHLRALGHRRVAVAQGPSSSWSGNRRLAGLRAAAEQFGDVELVHLGSFRPYFSGGHVAADHAAASGATAVVAFNDLMALGILDRLRSRGVRVPQDLSVVGYDDVAVATLVSPALTTVHSPLSGLGRRAVDLLVGRLRGATGTSTTTHLPVELVIRGSTGVPAPVTTG
ncbi:LacI family DNA-binding transcriptional regulator [Antribacter gilvus]|uniref:LacI family DNA-binding transcriptional regulator n=1 Tax=Antribacter gilvus TaxID=2304675 RepID=UPI000F77F4F4|nr:LacI family DNA-binding transcriptional regulator [Antribacter gilvus]